MEKKSRSSKAFMKWLCRIQHEQNKEQLDLLYSNFPDQLGVIFFQWLPEALEANEIIALLDTNQKENLFTAINLPESSIFYLPFNISHLPISVQISLKSQENVLFVYKSCRIDIDQGSIYLPTHVYYIHYFLYACKTHRSSSFLDEIYLKPLLVLFAHYLNALEKPFADVFQTVAESYMLQESQTEANCEFVYILLYFLQSPSSLLLPSHRILNINPSSRLFALHDLFYEYFKRSIHIQGTCYPLIELWLQYLTPWKRSVFISDFFSTGKIDFTADKEFSGFEPIWEGYVHWNLLFYTDLFCDMIRFISSENNESVLNALLKASELFHMDADGWMVNRHVNFSYLLGISNGAKASSGLEEKMQKFSLPCKALCPFKEEVLMKTIENILFTAYQSTNTSLLLETLETIQKNFKKLLNLDSDLRKTRTAEIKLSTNYKSLLNVWEKPLRSDEILIFYLIAKYLSFIIDRSRGVYTWPPSQNLRFLSSFPNLLFISLIALVFKLIFF